MDVIRENSYIELRDTTLDELSFCESNLKGLRRWVERLPMANVGESARQLYVAIQDIVQFKCKPKDKFAMLEALRPAIIYIGDTLDRKYLANKIRLDEHQRKIANLAMSLENHLAAGYKQIIAEMIDSKPRRAKDFQEIAFERMIMTLDRELLRFCYLYIPVPEGFWAEIHNIYAVAAHYGCAAENIEDDQLRSKKTISVNLLYVRALLLGSSQPNQLLQSELVDVFELLEYWSDYCVLHEEAGDSCSLLIEKSLDASPFFLHLVSGQSINSMRGLDTTILVEKMRHAAEVRAKIGLNSDAGLQLNTNVSNQLLIHLLQAWSSKKQRHFKRLPTRGSVKLIVGMTAIHYFMSKQTSLAQFIAKHVKEDKEKAIEQAAADGRFSAKDAKRVVDDEDVWQKAYDVTHHNQTIDMAFDMPNNNEHHIVHEAELVNVSPKGVCLEWKDDNSSLKSGELVAVHEAGKKRWNVGLIRWIRQNLTGGARFGIELIATEVTPVTARTWHVAGQHGEFVRALMVAATKDTGGNETLIVPSRRFHSNEKIEVWSEQQAKRFILERRILTSSSMSQYLLRRQDAQNDSAASKDFGNIWQNL